MGGGLRGRVALVGGYGSGGGVSGCPTPSRKAQGMYIGIGALILIIILVILLT